MGAIRGWKRPTGKEIEKTNTDVEAVAETKKDNRKLRVVVFNNSNDRRKKSN